MREVREDSESRTVQYDDIEGLQKILKILKAKVEVEKVISRTYYTKVPYDALSTSEHFLLLTLGLVQLDATQQKGKGYWGVRGIALDGWLS